jgi:hypothetical protein
MAKIVQTRGKFTNGMLSTEPLVEVTKQMYQCIRDNQRIKINDTVSEMSISHSARMV